MTTSLFICSQPFRALFNDAVSISVCRASNGRMTGEQRIRRKLPWPNRFTIPECSTEENHNKSRSGQPLPRPRSDNLERYRHISLLGRSQPSYYISLNTTQPENFIKRCKITNRIPGIIITKASCYKAHSF
jgi:hypothetical protein